MRLQHSFALHPILNLIHRFKQRLCYLLLKKHRTRKQCEKLAPRLLRAVYQLRHAQLPQLMALGETLHSWSAEIATMWRFTRNNGITEGLVPHQNGGAAAASLSLPQLSKLPPQSSPDVLLTLAWIALPCTFTALTHRVPPLPYLCPHLSVFCPRPR